MKVIEGPPHWSMRVACRQRHCGTKLEIEESDIKWGAFGPNWGGESPELKFYAVCPNCKHMITLDIDDLPRTAYDRGAAWWEKNR